MADQNQRDFTEQEVNDMFDNLDQNSTSDPFDALDNPEKQFFPETELRAQPLSQNLYKGMTPQQAQGLYEELVRLHGPEYRDPITGDKVTIPAPGESFLRPLDEAGPNLPQMAVGIVGNNVRRLAQTGAAIVDKGVDLVRPLQKVPTGYNEDGSVQGWRDQTPEELQQARNQPGLTEKVQKEMPVYPTTGLTRIADEGVGMAFGGGMGIKGAGAIIKMRQAVPTWFNWMKNMGLYGTAGAAGTAAFAPDEGSTLFGDLVDLGDDEAARVLEHRFDVFVEALALQGAFEAGAGGIRFATGLANDIFLQGILTFGNEAKKEEKIVTSIINQLSAATGKETEEQRKELALSIAEMIRDNKDELIKLSEIGLEDMSLTRDTMGALEYALRNGNNEEAARIVTRARELRKGAMAGGAPETELATNKAARIQEDVFTGLQNRFGGDQSIDQAGKGLQQEANRQFSNIKSFQNDLEQAIYDESIDVAALIREDPAFSDKLRNAASSVGFDINFGSRETSQQIRAKLKDMYKTMTAEKDRLYNAIPDGAYIDPDVILEDLADLTEMLPTSIGKALEESGGDYKKIHNEILPMISRELQSIAKIKNSTTAEIGVDQVQKEDALLSLREFINDKALDYVIEGSDDQVAEAAQTARAYYKSEYVPFWRDGSLEKLGSFFKQEQGGFKPVTARQGQLDTFRNAVDPRNEELTKHLVDAMARPEYNGNPSDFMDYILGTSAEKILEQVQAGKTFDEASLAPVFQELRQYAGVIKDRFPDQYERLNDFVTKVNQKKSNIKALEEQLKGATKAVEDVRKNIYEGEFKEFFVKNGIGLEGAPNSYKSFEQMFANPQNQERINRILEQGMQSDNPVIVDGMKAAVLKYLRNKITTSTDTIGGARRMNTPAYDKMVEGSDPTLDYLDIIFKEEPTIPYAIKKIMGLNDEQALASRVQGSGVASIAPTEFLKDARANVDTIITQIYGPLDRLGARLRSVASRTFNSLNKNEQTAYLVDKIFSDPNEFLRVLDAINVKGNTTKKTVSTAKVVTDMLIKYGIFGSEDRPILMDFYSDLDGGFTPDPEVPRQKIEQLRQQQQDQDPFTE